MTGSLLERTGLTTGYANQVQFPVNQTLLDPHAMPARPAPIEQFALECFEEVRQLPAGWDGRSARAPSPTAIVHAATWLVDMWRVVRESPGIPTRTAVLAPQVFPRPSGGVQFEWLAGDAHVEVAIEPDGGAMIAASSRSLGIDCEAELEPFWPGRPPKAAISVLAEIFAAVWAARPPKS